MKPLSNTLRVRVNQILLNELNRAAAECSSAADDPISPEEYAAEIIESYMASRRLGRADAFIGAISPSVDALLIAHTTAVQ
jgi:hypothetical protein